MIGWADLPSTQVSVPCTDVLDWVSPREVERWEYNDLLRREDEKLQEGLKAAEIGTGKRRKRGGKTRKPRQQAVEPSPPILKPEDEALISQKKAAGPSLSTPQKRKFKELLQEDTEADEVDGNDPDATALFRQLNGSDIGAQPSADEYGMYAMYGSTGQLGTQAYSSTADDEESRASSLIPAPKPARTEESSPTRLGPRRPSPVPPSGAHFWAKPLTTPTENQMESDPAKKKLLVNAFDLLRDGSRNNGLSKSKTSSPKSATPAQPNGTSHEEKPRAGFTPIPGLKSKSSQLFTSIGPIAPSPTASTPVGKTRDTPASAPASERKLPKSAQKEPKRRKTVKEEATPMQDEDAFEVKALLDDRNDYDDNGNLVKYFQVLWVGNWPEWQNPSWEPEDNISDDLIAEYTKKKESKMKNGYLTGPSPKKQRPSPWMPQKRYSNVAEAFAGDIDIAQPSNAKEGEAVESEEGDDEVLLVTEDKG